MSQFNLDLSYNFKGIKARSKSVQSSLDHSRQNNMEFADDFAGDVFNALYQHNPQLGAENNSKYSQAIRAALSSAQFQHLRMQTRDSVHWSSVAAALITSTLAKELNFGNEEEPPEKQYGTGTPTNEKSEPNDDETIVDNIIPNPEAEPQSGEEDGQEQSSEKFDENAEDSDESDGGENESDSDNDDQTDQNEEGDNNSDSESDNTDGEDEESGESDGDNLDNQTPEPENNEDSGGNGDNDSDNESDENEEESDNDGEEDDGSDESSDPVNESAEPINEPGQDIKDALNKAAKEVEQLMGGIRAGTSESMLGSKGDSELAELYTALGNNPRLSELMRMIGRMQISQHFLNGVSYAQTQTPVAITMGKDIRNVLPQDLGLLLGNTEEFNVFAAKYNNNELLQKQLKAETKTGKGPMIVCLDESGSMMGDKITWATSITIAMYLQCLKDRRQFALVKFASNARLWDIPKSTVRMDIDFLSSIENHGYLGGGTNFQEAWREATKFIRSNAAWKQADIVFVTDGMGNYNQQIMKQDKDQLSVRLISFLIDPTNDVARYMGYGGSTAKLVTDFIDLNDAFTHIQDLSERGERQAFELIRRKQAKGHFEVVNGRLQETTIERREEELSF